MPRGKVLRKNEEGEFEEVIYSSPTPEMLILSKLDGLKEKLDVISNKLLITETISKDQYEQRLKANMTAMLTELQLEFDEVAHYRTNDDPTLIIDMSIVNDIIQQKINSLKEEKDKSIKEDPCIDCKETNRCGGFMCKEAREYIDNKQTNVITKLERRKAQALEYPSWEYIRGLNYAIDLLNEPQ